MTEDPQKLTGTEQEEPIPAFYELVEQQERQIVVNFFGPVNITNNQPTPNQDAKLLHFINSTKASWIFGSILLFLIIGLLFAGPDHLVPYKLMILGHLVAFCAAFLTFFLSGSLGLEIHSIKNDWGKLSMRAVGGLAIYALTIFIWLNPSFGIMTLSTNHHPEIEQSHN